MSSLKYLNQNYPLSSVTGSQDVMKCEFAVDGRFTVKDVEDATVEFHDFTSSIFQGLLNSTQKHLKSSDRVKNDKQESVNKTLIILGLALINERQDIYEEMYFQLPPDVIETRYIHRYDEMIKPKNSKVRHFLQMMLLCSFVIFDAKFCAKVLGFADSRNLKVTVNHQQIGVILHNILNANSEKPDYQILRLLIEKKVCIELKVDSESIIDEKAKKAIISRMLFNEFVQRKIQHDQGDFKSHYFQQDAWDINNGQKHQNDIQTSSGDSKQDRKVIGLIKLVSLNDYLETMLPLVLARPQLQFQVTCLVLEMNQLFDCVSVGKLLLDFQLYDPILAIIDLLMDAKVRQNFTTQVFISSIQTQQLSFAVRIFSLHQPTLIYDSEQIIPCLLTSLKDDPFQMEIKMDLLQNFTPFLLYRHVDDLIEIFVILVHDSGSSEGIMINNINPFMVAVKILQINHNILGRFPLARIRIEQYQAILIKKIVVLLDNLYMPQIIKNQLKQKDLMGYTALERLAELDMLEILQTKIVDRILKDIWSSKIDVSGTIMDNSSCFTILRYGDIGYDEDFEFRYRFYVDRATTRSTIRPHILTFRVWCESIKLRYFIEMLVYFGLLMGFQQYVSNYNNDLNNFDNDVADMQNLTQRMLDNNTISNNGLRILEKVFQVATSITNLTAANITNSTGNCTGKSDQFCEYSAEKEALRQTEIQAADDVVQQLDDSMNFGAMAFTLPLQMILNCIFCYLAKRKMTFSLTYLFDLCIVSCMIVWFYMYDVDQAQENDGMGLEAVPSESQMFLDAIITDIHNNVFYFDFLLAFTVLFFWLRFLVMLMLTETFGPLLEIVSKMMIDMFIFFGVYIIQMVKFASVGMLLFAELPEFDTLESALLLVFQSSLGNFDFTVYDTMDDQRQIVGTLYQILVLCSNMLLLMNLLIAVMSETYQRFTKFKTGLLHKAIIFRMPVYKFEKSYSCLISAPAPLNVLVVPFLPYFFISTNVRLTRWVNKQVLKLLYLPVAFVAVTAFFVGNLICLPLAFVKALFHKMLILRRLQTRKSLSSFISFSWLGFPILAIGQIFDLFNFISHLYQWEQKESTVKSVINTLPRHIFYQILQHLRDHYKTKPKISGSKLVLELQAKLEVPKHMRMIIFGVSIDSEKRNELQTSILYLQTFNLIKQIIWNCVIDQTDAQDKEVSLRMIIGLMSDIETKLDIASHSRNGKKGKVDAELDSLNIEHALNSENKVQLSRFSYIQPLKIYQTLNNPKFIQQD